MGYITSVTNLACVDLRMYETKKRRVDYSTSEINLQGVDYPSHETNGIRVD